MTTVRRCAGITVDGAACRSFAVTGSDHCHLHGDVDSAGLGRSGGIASAERRSVRNRFREDAERSYSERFESLSQAINAEVTRWGDYPHFRHRVPMPSSDISARTQAIPFLLGHGYRKPQQSVFEVQRNGGLEAVFRFLLTRGRLPPVQVAGAL